MVQEQKQIPSHSTSLRANDRKKSKSKTLARRERPAGVLRAPAIVQAQAKLQVSPLRRKKRASHPIEQRTFAGDPALRSR
jgi:hypothetical protein